MKRIYLLIIIMISCILLIVTSLIHPEIVTEQFGVISRERASIYDHLILIALLVMLVSIIIYQFI